MVYIHHRWMQFQLSRVRKRELCSVIHDGTLNCTDMKKNSCLKCKFTGSVPSFL